MQGDGSHRSRVGGLIARVAGLGALVVAVVLVAMVLFGGDSRSQVQAAVRDRRPARARQPGPRRRPADRHDRRHHADRGRPGRGRRSRSTSRFTRGPRPSSAPPRSRASPTATSRSPPGPTREPEIPDDGLIAADQTTSPVDLDQLFNTLDETTRTALQDVIKGQATIYTGNNRGRARDLQVLRARPPGDPAPARRADPRPESLSRFLVEGDTALGAIAARRDDLSALTQNANQALGAIAERNDGPRPHPRRPAAGDAPGATRRS